MTKKSKISETIDYSKDGKHFGYLSIPHSTNDSGWGSLQMPIISIRNGEGPVAVFTGGNHGDEYEGPIALMKIARSLDNNNINGQIIIIPALNFPALMAGDRVSPIDGLNMNRAFPGKRDGSVTSMIADYLTTKIIPLADVFVDIHSGGKTMMFSPFATYQNVPNIGVNQKAKEAALGFRGSNLFRNSRVGSRWNVGYSRRKFGKSFCWYGTWGWWYFNTNHYFNS